MRRGQVPRLLLLESEQINIGQLCRSSLVGKSQRNVSELILMPGMSLTRIPGSLTGARKDVGHNSTYVACDKRRLECVGGLYGVGVQCD